MIKKSIFEEELIYGMQRELQGFEKNAGMNDLAQAANYLQAALEIFEEAGLTAQADQLLSVLQKIAEDDQDAKKGKSHKPAKNNDPHVSGLTSEKMVENLKHHGTVFNMADDGKADTMLDVELADDSDLEVVDKDKSFEDESYADTKAKHKSHICPNCEEPMTKTETGNYACIPCEGEREYRGSRRNSKTAAKYGQQAVPTVVPPPATPPPGPPPPGAPPAAAPAVAPAQTPAEAAAAAAAKKAALEAAKAAATAAKAAAEAAATAAKDATEKLKTLESDASLQALFSKYSDNAAPSAHIRSWDPLAKGTLPSEKPSINHVEGNIGTGGLATDPKSGLGVDAPSHKATDNIGGVNAPDHKATDLEAGKGVDAPSHKATDGDSSHAETAGGAPLKDEPTDAPVNSGSGGNGPSDVRSPTSTEVRSPTSTEVRSPTSTEVRSPTSTSTEVRSPTSTSTEAYTADNFTATVTGGAGDGANTTVNIYLSPPSPPKTNPNIPHNSKDSKALVNYLMSKYGR